MLVLYQNETTYTLSKQKSWKESADRLLKKAWKENKMIIYES